MLGPGRVKLSAGVAGLMAWREQLGSGWDDDVPSGPGPCPSLAAHTSGPGLGESRRWGDSCEGGRVAPCGQAERKITLHVPLPCGHDQRVPAGVPPGVSEAPERRPAVQRGGPWSWSRRGRSLREEASGLHWSRCGGAFPLRTDQRARLIPPESGQMGGKKTFPGQHPCKLAREAGTASSLKAGPGWS